MRLRSATRKPAPQVSLALLYSSNMDAKMRRRMSQEDGGWSIDRPPTRLEHLPLEIVTSIFALLSLQDKVQLLSVSQTWKRMTEDQLLRVRWISSGLASCSFPSGCVSRGREHCPQAEDPSVLRRLLVLCPNVQRLELDGSDMLAATPEARKTVSKLLQQMLRVRCLTWKHLDLNESACFEDLKHLRCNSISSRSLRSLLPAIEGLGFTSTNFRQWERMPLGLRFLIEEGKDPSIDLSRLLRSQASQSLERLKINCIFPESLPMVPVLPRLSYLRIRDCHEEFNSRQLSLLKTVIENSQARELYLGVPNVLDDPLVNLKSFFASFQKVETIRQALFIEEHQVVHHLVHNSPLVKTAELIVTSITEEVLTLLLGWKNLKKLTLASPGTLRRCTTPELLRFIDAAFTQSIEQLHLIDKLHFTRSDQDELIRIMSTRDLKVSFRVGKRFIDAKQKPFSRNTGRTIKSPMLLVHAHRFRSYNS